MTGNPAARGSGASPPVDPPPTRSRRLVHGLLVVLGWLLFVWSWRRVTAASPEAGELGLLVLGSLVVVPALTMAWVLHNLGIYRRKGPRRKVAVVQRPYERDFNGRRIEADWAALATARRIVIALDGDTKRFVAVEQGAAPVAQEPPG